MARPAPQTRSGRFTIVAAGCVVIAALYFAQAVLIPLALATLVSFLLAPLCTRLERAGLPRIPSVLLVFMVVLALVGVLGWVVYVQMLDLADRLPQHRDDIALKVRSLVGTEPGALGKAAAAIEDVGRSVAGEDPATQPATTAAADETVLARIERRLAAQRSPTGTEENPMVVRVAPERPSPMERLSPYIGGAIGIAATAGLVLVFVIFILLARNDLRDRLIRLVGLGELNLTTTALDDAATRISRYLLALAIVNGTYGIAISIGLWIIGRTVAGETFPNFVLWGLLCTLLRFIPYVGPWIAASFPLVMAFAVFPGFKVFLAVGLMFVVIELISNNLMEPWLYGASTGMTTVAVLIAAVFWTWLWGPIGLVMATPLTVCLVVLGKHVPQLKFFDIMLGDEPVLSPPERIYQRLLAMDGDDVAELADSYLHESGSLDYVYDNVLLPALAMAEQDRHRGRLDERRQVFIRHTFRSMLDELLDEYQRLTTKLDAKQTVQDARSGSDGVAAGNSRLKLPKECVVHLVCLPAHDEADELVCIMLSQLLTLRGYCATAVSTNALASEMLDEINKQNADLVCVSALPPAAVGHARYLCKRIHTRFPDIRMVVGLWTIKGDLNRAKQRITCGTDDITLASSLDGVQEKIDQLIQPLILRATVPASTSTSP
jgi:predicted PurR-regulated permease PerM